MLTHDQKCAMLPFYRQAQYPLAMSEIARNLRDSASENFHANEYRRLMRETIEAGGLMKEK